MARPGVVTEQAREAVKPMVKQGKTTNEISAAVKLSTATVQNIKNAAGLVRTKKKK